METIFKKWKLKIVFQTKSNLGAFFFTFHDQALNSKGPKPHGVDHPTTTNTE